MAVVPLPMKGSSTVSPCRPEFTICCSKNDRGFIVGCPQAFLSVELRGVMKYVPFVETSPYIFTPFSLKNRQYSVSVMYLLPHAGIGLVLCHVSIFQLHSFPRTK